MDIAFDPFTFGATTLALIIATIELYYTRPRRVHQVRPLMLTPILSNYSIAPR
jgi:hypothetical protein